MKHQVPLLVAAALLLCSCGGEESLPPFFAQTVGPAGGTFALQNGYTLLVPPGAVDSPAVISLRRLSESEKAALTNNGATPRKRFLGGFLAQPDGLTFNAPIRVVVPLEQALNPGGLPLMVTTDRRNRSYVAATQLEHDPDAGTATFELTHFSYWAEVEAELQRAATECTNPETACRCGTIRVESEATDFSSGECQSVSDTVRVQFLDCPGQPTEESTLSDETAGCDDEDDTGPPPQPPGGERWHGVLTLELDYAAPILQPHDGVVLGLGIKAFHDTAVYDFELDWADSDDTWATATVNETHTTSFVPFDNEVVLCGENHGTDTNPRIHLDTTVTSSVSVAVVPVHRTVLQSIYPPTRTLDFLDGLVAHDADMPFTLPGYLEGFYVTVDVTQRYDDGSSTSRIIYDSTVVEAHHEGDTYYTGFNQVIHLWNWTLWDAMVDACAVPSPACDYQLRTGDRLLSAPLEEGTTVGSGSFAPMSPDIGMITFSFRLTLAQE